MNILFYDPVPFAEANGGIARVSLVLMRELRKLGHSVWCVSFLDYGPQDVDENQLWLPVRQAPACDENTRYMVGIIKENKIDIIVNQRGIDPRDTFPYKWRELSDCKIVTVLHNSLFGIYGWDGKAHQFGMPYLKSRLLDGLCHKYFKRKYGRGYRLQVAESARMVTLSERFFPEVDYFSGMHAYDVVAIPNALTVKNSYNPDVTKEKELLFVGRLAAEKQVDKLLGIWNLLQDVFPDWRLTIVGDGAEKDKLQRIASKLHLKRVSFEGYKDPEPYYQRARIFCMTSAFEGFGLVLIEAMHFGCVPVAFNSYANVVDIITDKTDGLLVTPFSLKEYAGKLSSLMSSPEQLATMAHSARIKAKQYSVEAIVRRWETLFKEIIDEEGNKRDGRFKKY